MKGIIQFPHLRSVPKCSWEASSRLIRFPFKHLELWPWPFLKVWVTWSNDDLHGEIISLSEISAFIPPSLIVPGYSIRGFLPVPGKWCSFSWVLYKCQPPSLPYTFTVAWSFCSGELALEIKEENWDKGGKLRSESCPSLYYIIICA